MDASGILLLVIVGILFAAALIRNFNGASKNKNASYYDSSNNDYYDQQNMINHQTSQDQMQIQQDFVPDQQWQIEQQDSYQQSIDTSSFDSSNSFPDNTPMTDSGSSAGTDSTNY